MLRKEEIISQHHEELSDPWERVPLPRGVTRLPFFDGDIAVVEFPLLLTIHQARALEEVAQGSGLTVGQMTRRLIRDFLERE